MKSNEPLRMLPRFDSQSNSIYKYEKMQLPKCHSDESQSHETRIKTISEIKRNIDHSNKFDIKFLERSFDRSGKKCWPMVNTNIGKIDLEYTYEIVGNTIESYIRCRKLNQCKALSNFIEYRNKIFKREKIGQYALPESKKQMKEINTQQTINIPTKIIHVEGKQTPSVPPSPSPSTSTISETISSIRVPSSKSMTPAQSAKSMTSVQSSISMTPAQSSKTMTPVQSSKSRTPVQSSKSMTSAQSSKSRTPVQSSRSRTPVQSSKSMTSKTSQKLSSPTTKEAFIPIPSSDLLRSPTPKHSKINIPKEKNGSIKQISSPSVKGSSESKSKVTFKTITIPMKTF